MEKVYKNQVKLLLEVLPLVAKEPCFALHGGTAINLFIRNMPRLSVDIDLTYLLLEDWETSILNINNALERIGLDIVKNIAGTKVNLRTKDSKLDITTDAATIKLEVSKIGRGCYAEPEVRVLCEKAQEEYNTFCEISVVPFGQLYGGKLCAALDRQHPRDLFDVKYLLANEGINEEIKRGFLFCLLGAKRPLSEMLNPNFLDQQSALERQFAGMSVESFSYEDYELVKKQMVKAIHASLNEQDKNFLLAFKTANPNWEKHKFEAFPSVRRKIQLLSELKDKNPNKHADLVERLKKVLGKSSEKE